MIKRLIDRDLLPPPNTKRWVAQRKATVVAAVRANVLSLKNACERYDLTVEEFRSWERVIDKYGVRGLRATRLGEIRKSNAARFSSVARTSISKRPI